MVDKMCVKKAQSGVELIMLVSFLLFIFSAYYLGIMEKNKEAYQNTLNINSEELLANLAMILDTAIIEGNGYSIEINLPDRIVGKTYILDVKDNIILLNVSNKMFYHKTLAKKVNGKFSPGTINIIENVNGSLYVYQK